MGMCRLGRRGWFRAQTACRLDDGDSPCGVTTFKNDLCRLGDAQDSQQTAVHGCGVKQPTDRSRSRISDTFSSKVTNFFWRVLPSRVTANVVVFATFTLVVRCKSKQMGCAWVACMLTSALGTPGIKNKTSSKIMLWQRLEIFELWRYRRNIKKIRDVHECTRWSDRSTACVTAVHQLD